MGYYEFSVVLHFSPIMNQPFFCCLLHFSYIGETKLIREATLKNHIPGSLRGIPILRLGLELPWSQLNLRSVKRPWYAHQPVVSEDHGQ